METHASSLQLPVTDKSGNWLYRWTLGPVARVCGWLAATSDRRCGTALAVAVVLLSEGFKLFIGNPDRSFLASRLNTWFYNGHGWSRSGFHERLHVLSQYLLIAGWSLALAAVFVWLRNGESRSRNG